MRGRDALTCDCWRARAVQALELAPPLHRIPSPRVLYSSLPNVSAQLLGTLAARRVREIARRRHTDRLPRTRDSKAGATLKSICVASRARVRVDSATRTAHASGASFAFACGDFHT